MAFYSDYPPYVPVAEKKRRNLAAVEKMKKKNPDIAPVVLTGNKLTSTWWGKSWNDNLERYSDYANRIGRGRSYVRHGAVLDLKLSAGRIEALVQGSESRPYTILIQVSKISAELWNALVRDCAGQLGSMQELLAGKFPRSLNVLFTAKGTGLFPAPGEIKLSCSCPDSARMCKHVAAVLYGIGARLDHDPSLFFKLRGVRMEELVSEAIASTSSSLLEKSRTKGRRVMENADLSGVFGIDIDLGNAAGTSEDGAGRDLSGDTATEGEASARPSAGEPAGKSAGPSARKSEKASAGRPSVVKALSAAKAPAMEEASLAASPRKRGRPRKSGQ